MFQEFSRKRMAAASIVAALSLLLSSCFVMPGKFDSTLVIKHDDSFSFTYDGEIFFFGLSKMAMMGSQTEDVFGGASCFDEDTYEERECSESETAEQRAEWEAEAADRKRQKAAEARQMAAALGGVDPSDPDAGNEIARKLSRQRGWDSVEYVGDGVFNVRYAISGQLHHDFTFPVMETAPVPTPFVQAILRDDRQIRIVAPGFAFDESNGPMAGLMMGGLAGGMGAAMAEGSSDQPAEENSGISGLPVMEGTFTIITDGRILANNTDEGPQASDHGQMLRWTVSPQTKSPPTALIDLSH